MKEQEVKMKELKNGDMLLTFSPKMLKSLGWKKGDEIDMKVKDGKLYLKKL